MPTIKKIVRMNLTELIDWIWKNKIKDKKFVSEYVNSIVFVSKSGKISTGYSIGKTDTFKVDIEEEITEDTKLFLISRCIGEFGNVSYLYNRTTINRRLDNLPGNCKITHFYIENEDKELVLIWKNGELVE
ncbi:hypothetical protein NK211_13070 [Mammaliicoccus sciuri]|uniref:hypothetical protein n=1 Tax=Mammaliicoccus sciuri TaxID=1296 RepID=UPI00209F8658|nr:hypothetical protein [Mammaliicoccus sciuri]MCP1288310.1 hypothetical protein [Mammaliicoccus sciuri]